MPFLDAAGSDLVMGSERWTTSVVGKMSPWLELDSNVPSVRLASEKAFKQEVAWASHLSGEAAACLVQPLRPCVRVVCMCVPSTHSLRAHHWQ